LPRDSGNGPMSQKASITRISCLLWLKVPGQVQTPIAHLRCWSGGLWTTRTQNIPQHSGEACCRGSSDSLKGNFWYVERGEKSTQGKIGLVGPDSQLRLHLRKKTINNQLQGNLWESQNILRQPEQ
jgi:hypothetical protein